MSSVPEPLYDVFISYSPADEDWVDEWLLPHLQRAGLRAQSSYLLVGGAPKVENLADAISHSRRTVVVLTPEWVNDRWQAFAGALAVCRRGIV